MSERERVEKSNMPWNESGKKFSFPLQKAISHTGRRTIYFKPERTYIRTQFLGYNDLLYHVWLFPSCSFLLLRWCNFPLFSPSISKHGLFTCTRMGNGEWFRSGTEDSSPQKCSLSADIEMAARRVPKISYASRLFTQEASSVITGHFMVYNHTF